MNTLTPRRDRFARGAHRRSLSPFFLGILALLVLARPALASEFYVAPSGTSNGDGSIGRPWNLAKALSHPSAVRPGDTIWLRGGTYVGHFASALTGTAARPIIVRQHPGERATIDGNYGGNAVTLVINGSYTWYWGFEVTNSDPTRTSPTTDYPARRGEGINVFGPGTKLINLVIHDTSQGIGSATTAENSELYGNLIYYNGYDAPDRGHGHGIYAQNEVGQKRILDNLIFRGFGYGVHIYGELGRLNNFDLEGNASWMNGSIIPDKATTSFLLGGSVNQAVHPTLIENYSYYPEGWGVGFNIGYNAGSVDAVVRGNVMLGATALKLSKPAAGASVDENRIWGYLEDFEPALYPDNTIYSQRPAGRWIFIRPNKYEPGRANVVVYNWDGGASVNVDLAGVLTVGSRYEIRNAQDYFGPPVRTGTFTGSPINLPVAGLSIAKPVGWPTPPPTGPEFNTFIVSTAAPSSGCDPTYGDLNQDGAVDALDLVILSDFLAGMLQQGPPPFTAPLSRADLDLSGTVDAVDLVLLRDFIAGNLTCLPRP